MYSDPLFLCVFQQKALTSYIFLYVAEVEASSSSQLAANASHMPYVSYNFVFSYTPLAFLHKQRVCCGKEQVSLLVVE